MIEYLTIHPDVQYAMQNSIPIVIIESTIWLHGLPPKQAMSALKETFKIAEEEGAVPVVVMIANGSILVGVTPDVIQEAISSGQTIKVNVRDIPGALIRGVTAGTTVSATIFIAHLMKLPVVVTGGIGGVHRMAKKTFDISSDLYTLSQYPVTIVSSGVKTILDVSATMEMLETLSVPVVGYKSDYLPCFYCHESPYKAPFRVNTLEELAEMVRIRNALKLPQSIIVANPIPKKDAISSNLMEEIVEKALMEAEDHQVQGKDVTPFLLERLHSITGGDTVRANMALIKENVRLGSQLARLISY